MHTPEYHARFLLRDLRAFALREALPVGDAPVLLAVSGGLDSTILAHLFAAVEWPFALAHVNYQLRGAASDGDETFVRELAHRFDVPVHVARVAGKQFRSTQTAARDFRYTQFADWQKRYQYAAIATAHHADDSVETTVGNFIRGTGIRGLRGILPHRDDLIRPLLFARRSTLEAYAKTKTIVHRTDASNATTDYRRNRLRHEIIPALTQLNPQFAERTLTTQAHLRETEWLTDFATRTLLQQWLTPLEDGWALDLSELRRHPATRSILFAWLQPYGFGEVRITQLAQHILSDQSGGQFAGPTHTVRVKGRKAWLRERLDSM